MLDISLQNPGFRIAKDREQIRTIVRLFSSDLKTKSRRTQEMHKIIEPETRFKPNSLIVVALALVVSLVAATAACGGSEPLSTP